MTADVLVCLLLVVASLGFSVRHAAGHDQISPYDEYVYIDYYAKVLDQGVVREGEKTGDYARRYLSCHPNRVFGPWQPKLCPQSRNRPDALYPFGGSTAAGIYSPAYFLAVRVAAEPLILSGVDFVEAGRIANGLWLALAVVLLYGSLRRLKAPRLIGAGACLAMVGSVAAYWANTYLSTDGTGLAAGAAMLFTTIGYVQRRTRWRAVSLLLVAALAAALKIQNLEAVAISGLFLCMSATYEHVVVQRASRGSLASLLRDQRVAVGLGAIVVGVLTEAVWLAVRASLALGSDADLNVSSKFAFPSSLLLDMTDFLPGIGQGGIASPELGPWGDISGRVLTLVVVGGVIGVAWGRGALPWQRLLAWAVLLAAWVSGPMLSLAGLAVNHMYVPVTPRYGIPLLPGALACAAVLVPWDSRMARLGAIATGTFLFGLGLLFQQ